MRISVIVPIHNVEHRLLSDCLGSLLHQSLPMTDFEVILVDDCSDAPDTIAVLKRYETDEHFKIVHHSENQGLNEARRTGVKAAQGDYVLFLDGDDMLTRDGLELLRMEAHHARADVVTSGFQRWRPDSKELVDARFFGIPFSSNLEQRMVSAFRCERSFTMCGRLFRRRLLEDAVFDIPKSIFHEDLVTLPRIICAAERFGHVEKVVYYYTENEASITSTFTTKHLEGCLTAFSDWENLVSSFGLSVDATSAIRYGRQKLLSTMVARCQQASNLTAREKAEIFETILVELRSNGISSETSELPVIEALLVHDALSTNLIDEEVVDHWKRFLWDLDTSQLLTSRQAEAPPISKIALRLKGKIVFIGQVDYQVKNAALVARELQRLGYETVVLDNSGFVAGGKRQFVPENHSLLSRVEHIRVLAGPYGADWLSTASAVITFNDFNDDVRDALEYRQLLGGVTICAIEGINDFRRVDCRRREDDPYRFLPYRRCNTVFLAGRDDERFFEDRRTKVVGLPIVEELRHKVPTFPRRPVAALNVNFTYGVLEDKREEFLIEALSGIEQAGFDYVITQHPMDTASLDGFNVTRKSQYELIDEATVFVSRFATGIIEALASGKPSIYFNPHGERVDKFTNPDGAFEVAHTAEELAAALRRVEADIVSGVDFRSRANAFLTAHANYRADGISVAKQYALSIINELEDTYGSSSELVDVFYERLARNTPFDYDHDSWIFGDLKREHKAHLSDEDLVARVFEKSEGVMLDVGANLGDSLDRFLGRGWYVHAFEPDPFCRGELNKTWPNEKRLVVNAEAVEAVGGQERVFYTSDESIGINSLAPFTEGHRKQGKVRTISLRDYFRSAKLKHVDFLKVDVEGFDKFVLDGFPWEIDRPDVILAEFENRKTVPLGYTVNDLAQKLLLEGYSVYVSEWHPIVRYGMQHDWRRFAVYDRQLQLDQAWGNLIGFKSDPGPNILKRLVRETLTFGVSLGTEISGVSTVSDVPSMVVRRPFYANFANRLRDRSPQVFRVLRAARRLVAGAFRQ